MGVGGGVVGILHLRLRPQYALDAFNRPWPTLRGSVNCFKLTGLHTCTRRGVRAAEGAALEMLCTVTPYRGFKSRPLRQ